MSYNIYIIEKISKIKNSWVDIILEKGHHPGAWSSYMRDPFSLGSPAAVGIAGDAEVRQCVFPLIRSNRSNTLS